MIIDGIPRFTCQHEFVGLPMGGRPDYFRCHKCKYSKPIEVVVPGSAAVASFRRIHPALPAEQPAAGTLVPVVPRSAAHRSPR
jgi:hypothetical protein